ncbi:MAG: hypothetical protein Q8K21_11060 [Hydrogenophaga sp.]|uniref:hypothetical protein n=1 Tax=Hydrogenophaga sp. TaxID=1904254 RepID=UPI00272F6A7F|nr:hypothetical protein [Hydrogenophaga sp.]MDP2164735.1 hypothetical protein [Hydrogenophaga sp.]MDP3475512.1 hypothetical protein [Hydrogenophaga sp.]
MKKFIAVLVLVSMAWGASAQNLWRDAPMLASPAQIRALMPEARETSAAQRAADPSALLEIPSTPIADESFRATYHFESERLQRIHLRAQSATPARAQALLKTLQASLRTSFGLPVSSPSRPVAALGTVDVLWSFRRMTVQLLMVDGKTVELIYSANLPPQRLAL